MKRTTIDAGMRAGTRGLLAAVGTVALARAGSRLRRALMFLALAAIAEVLLRSDAPGGRHWLDALRPRR